MAPSRRMTSLYDNDPSEIPSMVLQWHTPLVADMISFKRWTSVQGYVGIGRMRRVESIEEIKR